MMNSWPPVEALEEVLCASGVEVEERERVVSIHGPGAHKYGYIDARGGWEERGGGSGVSGGGRMGVGRVCLEWTSRKHLGMGR